MKLHLFKKSCLITGMVVTTIPFVLTTISCSNESKEDNSDQAEIKVDFDTEVERILNLKSKIKFKQTDLNLQTLWCIHDKPNSIWNYLNQDFRNYPKQFKYSFYKIEFTFVNEMKAYFKLEDNLTNKSKVIVFDLTFKTIHSWT